jgi:hypothetical protein
MNTPLKQTSALAVTSLVCGVLGWTFAPWLGSIVAIVTGHLARAEIRREPDTREGDGLALAGLILGWASVLLSLLAALVAVLLIVFVFGGLAAFMAFLGLSGQIH